MKASALDQNNETNTVNTNTGNNADEPLNPAEYFLDVNLGELSVEVETLRQKRKRTWEEVFKKDFEEEDNQELEEQEQPDIRWRQFQQIARDRAEHGANQGFPDDRRHQPEPYIDQGFLDLCERQQTQCGQCNGRADNGECRDLKCRWGL